MNKDNNMRINYNKIKKFFMRLRIPRGVYCDGCPYWRIDPARPEQENGYCLYLQKGDWDFKYVGLLWDCCKECDVNL